MSLSYDPDTGEVIDQSLSIPTAQELATLSDTDLILISEQARDFALSELEADLAPGDALTLRSNTKAFAELIARHARSREAKLEAANNLTEARLRCERYIGNQIPAMQQAGLLAIQGQSHVESHDMTLSDIQITRDQSSLWQKIAKIQESDFEDYIATGQEYLWELSTMGLAHWANKGLADHQLINTSNNNEWYTPAPYIASVHAVLGEVDVDPASNAYANQTIQARTFYTMDDDGFKKDWPGRVFLNPPYGRDDDSGMSNQERWSARLIGQFDAKITTQAILLVNAVPGNRWFAPLWRFPICFVDHRIRFYNENTEAGQPTHSNVFVYLGPKLEIFAEEFSAHGVIAIGYGSDAWRSLNSD
jgi:ParB family chromosome partitioning protein